ncbi:MAG TPA: 2Fe-2S iron-sulfur cluster-binding protein [Steroidobacteraceae bacterium]|nr:2Fe-2S iron-sulfur cluster-binding protein [Steroidobacteraceae bacterium]
MYRLEANPDEWIDRSVPLSFVFEGKQYRGYRGDTISSALAASGVPYLARSFKYHRRRHILSFANHDCNALFQVDGVPNVRGDVTLVTEGMRASAVNTFGGLNEDKARLLDRLARWLPVGFYYKAFHTKRLFPRWERMFRTLTGLGVVSLDAVRRTTPKRYGFCDVLVVGGGPSGLSAALAAAAAGARVALVDESFRLGASGIGLDDGEQRATRTLIETVNGSPGITVCTATVAAAYYADHWIALADATRLTKMRAKAVVFAAGVIEQPAVFRNNDLPGVMLASAASNLLLRYRVAPGQKVVVVAGNLEGYRTALGLHAQNVRIVAIVDLRAALNAEEAAAAAQCAAAGMVVHRSHAPYEAIAGADGVVAALTVAPLTEAPPGVAVGAGSVHRIDTGKLRRIECDSILMSVGWAAAANLLLQAAGTTRFSDALQQFIPSSLPAGIFASGRLNGVYDFDARVADGARAGSAAAAHAGFGTARDADIVAAARCPSHPFPIIDHPSGKNFVDFDEDLQVKDLENAAQEGFDSSELLKRYSTVGMGPSQGKHSNMNALRVLARYRGVGVERLGLTTSRPMYHPVPLKLLAGRSFNAERRTPADAEHERLGAVWMPAGNWRRPEYYAVSGETRTQSIEAEVAAVRGSAGLIDVGTLGKIEIYGPQAGLFLDRVYTGTFSDLKVGMTRYGLMLDESGVIIDDGVIARISADMFYFTTTTGGSATVFRELQRWSALWGLDCALVNVTGHRAAFNFAGPLSRELLQPLTDADLGDGSFPFLGVRLGRVAGVPARLLRVGFVGELGYEIHVSASDAAHVWRSLHAAGLPRGARPFGVEAQRVLRLEKGHFIVGQDTDGLTDPFEANASWAVHMKKPYFVGQRSLRILKTRGPRQTLVGIELPDPARMPKECHLVIDQGAIAGRITSVAHSRTLNKAIGLAMLAPGLARLGGEIDIRGEQGEILKARIAPTPFYDPKNARQRPVVAA